MKSATINYPLLVLSGLLIGCFALIGLKRLHIDTDIIKTLPAHEQVIVDALKIFANHPIHDQVAVDIGINRDQPDILVACSTLLQQRMRASGLFAEVGMTEVGSLLPELAGQVAQTLPLLFSAEELEHLVAPHLESEAVRQRLQQVMQGMQGLESIGQSAFLAIDPLGLKDLVLAKLINLAPAPHAKIYRGNLLSEDGRHLLLTARPAAAGTDTAMARKLADLFAAAARDLDSQYAPSGVQVTLTPVGAYKAGLDNEEIIRHDVQLALGLTTAGIALLMLFAFPRPLLGLLTQIPAIAGIAMALFVYSLLHSSISIMVLGFSGALISLMDDHSITYLLFLDRPHATKGTDTAREVKSVGGTMALATTIGAFLVLSLSDFPVFRELGQFTALGFLFTYLFIHTLYPKIFPEMPAASKRNIPLHRLAAWLFSAGKPGAFAALALMLVLLFFARPEFRISLNEMNTVSEKTQADDTLFTSVWGNLGQKIYLMTTAPSLETLQIKNDRLLAGLEQDKAAGRIQSTFVPSMLFPGQERSAQNHAAWVSFWTDARKARLADDLRREGTALGFRSDAFDPFLNQLDQHLNVSLSTPVLPSRFERLLGISPGADGQLVQFVTITPGTAYNPTQFRASYGVDSTLFDPNFFSQRLGQILFSTFSSMLLIIATMVTLLLFFQFLNWQLTLITLSPLVFAYVCTLGTLKLIGHPLDIPGLMLSVIILGLGVDYSIYMVCGCQWYGSIRHPSHLLVRSAVLLSAASTVLGFGILCFARHATLRSVGITSLCGIGYSLLGTFLILPPLLEAYFNRQSKKIVAADASPAQRIVFRYRLLAAYPRLFARYKLKFDSLFRQLPGLLPESSAIRTVLDIGCGYGVPACWLLEHLPKIKVIGIDPDPVRVRVATRAAGDRATILKGAAPDLPAVQGPVEVILLLDMLHYLDHSQVTATLRQCRKLLAPGGLVIIRFVVCPAGRRSAYWYVEEYRVRLSHGQTWYRTTDEMIALMDECGFIDARLTKAGNRDLYWLTGQAGKACE